MLILASASESRKVLLRSSGVEFEVMPATLDEDKIKEDLLAKDADATVISRCLAEGKAQEISIERPRELVLGADQVLELNESIFSKAQTKKEAYRQLQSLRGRRHNLLSSLAVVRGGTVLWRYTDKAQLQMRDFSDDFLNWYIENLDASTLKTVGCYRLENHGVQLFSQIQGDFFTILGLPLLPLLEFLRNWEVLSR